MAKYATDDTIEFAGDYHLPSIVLHNHEGEGLTPDKQGHDIKAITQELNIYEIAEILDISTGRVSQIKSSALKLIRSKIKDELN